MKRVAFTIIYNGLHHLLHNDYAQKIIEMFDYWAIVEGSAGNQGSTSWCHNLERSINSTDGTVEFIKKLSEDHPNVVIKCADRQWISKDEQVNVALELLYNKINDEKCFLWEIDADEQWTHESIVENENFLFNSGKTCGVVTWNHFVGENLIATNGWGGGTSYRVWIWETPRSQRFLKHEPPVLIGTSSEVILPKKCNHYSYYYEQDVKFKSQWYGGHENVYQNWLKLQNPEIKKTLTFPLHISYLFGHYGYGGEIIYFNEK